MDVLRRTMHRFRENFFLFGLTCLIWYLIRTGAKPSRAVYPCQQAAALNANLWIASYCAPILGISGTANRLQENWKLILLVLALGAVSIGYMNLREEQYTETNLTPVKLSVDPSTATMSPSSDIYAVTGTNGADNGVERLLDLMSENGQAFYKSGKAEGSAGPNGLFSTRDVVIIKVNSQWDERGGTNTDLVSSIIKALSQHPDGWKGEIIVADNGQAQYGGAGRGGSLDWAVNNAQNRSQSIQDVVDMYSRDYRVSACLWDTFTTNVVQEFNEDDSEDGYVVETHITSNGVVISYPKFTTPYGTQVSFKYGVYRSEVDDYNRTKLKIINVPVLKTHMIYGVTGAVKHYMGVPSDKLSASLGYRIHSQVDDGAMGTLMAQTRLPTLNIIDAIYVNALPKDGPKTPYSHATETNIIAASLDPVAIDHWASKNILCVVCSENGDDVSTLDPDNTSDGEFGDWLRLSMDELNSAGYEFTCSPERINVFVSE